MRVLVTGAHGFAGAWLLRELAAAGHTGLPAPPRSELDLADGPAVAALVARTAPDAIAHLAAVSHPREAAADLGQALRANVVATWQVLAAALAHGRIPVLLASSSEVYAIGPDTSMPLAVGSPLGPRTPYGATKLAAEGLAHAAAAEGLPVAVVRPFNHTGPGQRDAFVVPALARRVVEAARTGSGTIVAGDVDVVRDLGDVRDTVRAYRLLLEALAAGRPLPAVVDVATGHGVAIREVVEGLAAAVGTRVRVEVDPALLRPDDPRRIVGDPRALEAATGWRPAIPLERTLADVVAAIHAGDADTDAPAGR